MYRFVYTPHSIFAPVSPPLYGFRINGIYQRCIF
nr:MAG TPA_asm: hypothetical protein [Caudoviricetes sp.]